MRRSRDRPPTRPHCARWRDASAGQVDIARAEFERALGGRAEVTRRRVPTAAGDADTARPRRRAHPPPCQMELKRALRCGALGIDTDHPARELGVEAVEIEDFVVALGGLAFTTSSDHFSNSSRSAASASAFVVMFHHFSK